MREDPTSSPLNAPRLLVIGVGNEYRGDDAAGLEIARRVRALGLDGVIVEECTGDVLGLVDFWREGDRVILADAVASGVPAGTIVRLDAVSNAIPRDLGSTVTSHGVGVAELVALARALHRLPAVLIAYAVEGQAFAPGSTLSPPVEAVLDTTAERIVEELRALSSTLPCTG